jgi:hypothetical protein
MFAERGETTQILSRRKNEGGLENKNKKWKE